MSFYNNEHTDPQLMWVRDGQVLVELDPTAAGWRSGSDPDRLDEVLGTLGFNLSREVIDPSDSRWSYDEHFQARTLALMQHLTGVQLTAGLLETATFRCAAVPDPHSWAYVTADPANIAPYTADGLAAQVRARLTGYAATGQDPDDEHLEDDAPSDCVETDVEDPWAAYGVTDSRLVATGVAGVLLFAHDPTLLWALAAAGPPACERVIRWAQLWAFTEAGLIDRPWFATIRRAVESGQPVSEAELLQAQQHIEPLFVGSGTVAGSGLPPGLREIIALGTLNAPEAADPLSAACADDWRHTTAHKGQK